MFFAQSNAPRNSTLPSATNTILIQRHVFLRHSRMTAKTTLFTMVYQMHEISRKTRQFDPKQWDKWSESVCFNSFLSMLPDAVIYMCFVHCQNRCKNTVLLYEFPWNLSQKYVFLQHSKLVAKTSVFTMLWQLSEINRKTRQFDTKRLDKWPESMCFYVVFPMLRRCCNLHVFCALPEYL